MSLDAPKYFPIDVTAIKKGDYISPETLQGIISVKNGTPVVDVESKIYRLGVLAAKQWIESELTEAGRPLVIKHDQDGLRVLKDAEAEPYLRNKQAGDLQRFERDHFRYSEHIDVGQLSLEQQNAYSDHVLKNRFLCDSLRQAKKKIALKGFTNTVPKLHGLQADSSMERED